MSVSNSLLNRRTVLGSGLAAGTALVGAGLALTACSPRPGARPSGANSSSGVTDIRPTRLPFDGPTPDLRGDSATGVPDAYLSYPVPVDTGRTPLGLSRPVEVLAQGYTPATPPERNQWWKQWESDLGTELKINVADSTQYTAKFQTAIAGNTLGELTQIATNVPQLPVLLDRMFTDLTPYLGGDNAKLYPNLANLPSAVWDMSIINGKLWGVARPRIPGGTVLMTRGDILKSKGIEEIPDLSDGDAFLDLCREVTDRSRGVFAIGQIPQDWTVPVIVEALGGPNAWQVTDGVWTSAYESPEYERALEIVAAMWKEGLIHPNSYTDLSSTAVWFDAGTTVLLGQNITTWSVFLGNKPYPLGVVKMPRWGGGGLAAKHLGMPGYDAPMGIRKTTDESRIEELLRVMDLVASPFGTRQYLHVNHGVEGRQFTMTDHQIVPNPEQTTAESVPGMNYAGAAQATVLHVPGSPDATRTVAQYLGTMMPDAVPMPSAGKFSDTSVTKGAAANRALHDLMANIIQGRAQLTQWRDGVRAWKAAAGDAIAREYAESE